MATGAGKTICFAKLPDTMKSRAPGQMLVLAHREELIDQAVSKLRNINPTLRIDKEKAEHRADPSQADCIVASVQSLHEKRRAAYNWANFDKYVIDEAHHSAADTYKDILNAAGMLEHPEGRLLLGVTATPQRGDGKALSQIYQEIVYSYSMRQAILDGYLADLRGYLVRTGANLDNVHSLAGDFNTGELSEEVNTPERNNLVVDSWIKLGDDRPTVAFCVDIQHSQDLRDEFSARGISAAAVWGTDPDRAEKIHLHKTGVYQVLTNCDVLTEGYDDWQIGCVVLAGPTKSNVRFTQRVGRGTRIQDGAATVAQSSKKDCIIIDMVDSTSRHTLVTVPTLLGLNAGFNLKGKSLVDTVAYVEALQAANPNIDFKDLKDADKAEAYIENVNLFDVKYPEEIEAVSHLSWTRSATGGYRLWIPQSLKGGGQKEYAAVQQNMLDKWDMSAVLSGKSYKGTRGTIEEAFKATEDLVAAKIDSRQLSIVDRGAPWTKKKATTKQLNLLRRLYKGRPLPDNLTAGKAKLLIDARLKKKH